MPGGQNGTVFTPMISGTGPSIFSTAQGEDEGDLHVTKWPCSFQPAAMSLLGWVGSLQFHLWFLQTDRCLCGPNIWQEAEIEGWLLCHWLMARGGRQTFRGLETRPIPSQISTECGFCVPLLILRPSVPLNRLWLATDCLGAGAA